MTADVTTAGTGSYEELTRLVRRAGLMDRRSGYYVGRIAANLLLLAAAWTVFVLLGDSWWQLATAVLLAFCFGQTDLVGHDAGHRQIARTRRPNDAIGYLHGNLLTGVSFGWWVAHHTRHHNYPNHISLDPDIQRRQVIFDVEQSSSRTTAFQKFVVRHQAWFFYVLTMLEGLRLHVAGYVAARRGALVRHRRAELAVLSLHVAGYLLVVFTVLSPLKAVAFVVVHQALFGFYMGLLFAPNHKGMPVRDGDAEELDWLTRQVVTSRNLVPSRIGDVFYGGLNYQIEHHLFPAMPRCNLRHSQPLIKEYVLGHGLPYAESRFLESYREVSEHLGKVSGQVRALDPTAAAASAAEERP